jgi:hypothetical protein
VRNPRGARARARTHGGAHTKTEGLETDISADVREFDTARAGLSVSEGEEELEESLPQEGLPEGVGVQPVAPPLTPHGVQAVGVKPPPELQ